MSDPDLDEDSTPMSLDEDRSFVEKNDFLRLERKVDALLKASGKLLLFEERQVNQASAVKALEARLGILEKSIEELDKKVERWINRGIGVWTIVGILWVVLSFLSNNGIILSHTVK